MDDPPLAPGGRQISDGPVPPGVQHGPLSSDSGHDPAVAAPVSPSPSPSAIDPDSLVIDDFDRYSRLRLITWWRQERLQAARVLVVGAGALGNEVLKNLALVGL